MSATTNPPPDLPGYTFLEGIGSGGFADVFLFRQHSTGQAVAIKVLRTEHLGGEGLESFRSEATIMARISSHPNIVDVYDTGVAGEGDGRPYIVMKVYPQANFAERAVGGRLQLSEVLRTCILVCSAVETAHRAGILHRDIKPANILTGEYDEPALTDFGIAGVQGADGMTALGGASYGFVAPEIIADDDATGSAASDVYAMTATMYALLTGRAPVHVPGGDNRLTAMVQRTLTGGHLPLGRQVPRSLEHLVNAGLSVDPDQRPATAEALALALQQVEQELQLPHTALVLRGTAPAPARPLPGDDDDEEGTVQRDHRPRAQVISPDRPKDPAPGPSRRSAPIASVPAASPPVDLPTQARGMGVRAPVPEHVTVARDGAAGAAGAAAPAPAPVRSEGRSPADDSPRPRWLIPAAAAAAIGVVALVAGIAAFAGGGEGTSAATTVAAAPQRQDPVGPASVPAPTEVTIELAAPAAGTTTEAGRGATVAVSWTAPEGVDTADDVRYRVSRVDGVTPNTVADDLGEVTAEIDGLRASDEGTICVEVYAVIGDTISDASPPACTEAP